MKFKIGISLIMATKRIRFWVINLRKKPKVFTWKARKHCLNKKIKEYLKVHSNEVDETGADYTE